MGYETDRLYVGATNYVNYSPQTRSKLRYEYYLLQSAMEQINQNLHNADILRWSTGCRPVSFDNFPLIGKTSIEDLWLLSGTYRDGFHFSPLLAQEIAKKILGSKESWIGEVFPAERYPIQTMNPSQSIEQVVQQLTASGYEHGMHLPRIGWDDQLPGLIRRKIQQIYNTLDCNYGLPVEIVLMLDKNPRLIPGMREYLQTISSLATTTTML